jgi:hypothetical protein
LDFVQNAADLNDIEMLKDDADIAAIEVGPDNIVLLNSTGSQLGTFEQINFPTEVNPLSMVNRDANSDGAQNIITVRQFALSSEEDLPKVLL